MSIEKETIREFKSKKIANNSENKVKQIEALKFISDQLVKGRNRTDIRKQLMADYGICQKTANNYIHKVYQTNLKLDETELAGLRFLQLQRLEKVFNEAMERNQLKVAVSAADTINKLFNLYENKYKVEIEQKEIKFTFDGAVVDAEPVEYTEVENNDCVVMEIDE